MKILVVGNGGREHAVCWKLSQSEQVEALYCAPGNPGTAEVAENLPIPVDALSDLVTVAKEKQIDLTIVGPEYPLTLGIVDEFERAGLKIFGPSKEAARIEGSKAFAKEVMESCGVPTAAYRNFDNVTQALEYVDQIGAPLVVKADGLAAGKGVVVCHEVKEAREAVRHWLDEPGARVVIEEFLEGVEASFIAAVYGDVILPLASSHDYKRISDGDQGPNTGGMGTVSPTPRLSASQEAEVVEQIMRPVVAELFRRGSPFCGFLYAGLMIDADGNTKVLEFNARLGDPETQVIMRRMDCDFAEVLLKLVNGDFTEAEFAKVRWKDAASVCVVLASEGYPESPRKGDDITGLEQAAALEDIVVFHAGTAVDSKGSLVTAGGRVLNVTSLGRDIAEARTRAYEAAAEIQFSGAQLRRDIAA